MSNDRSVITDTLRHHCMDKMTRGGQARKASHPTDQMVQGTAEERRSRWAGHRLTNCLFVPSLFFLDQRHGKDGVSSPRKLGTSVGRTFPLNSHLVGPGGPGYICSTTNAQYTSVACITSMKHAAGLPGSSMHAASIACSRPMVQKVLPCHRSLGEVKTSLRTDWN